MSGFKLWLANNIVAFSYRLLCWAWQEKIKSEAKDPDPVMVFFEGPPTQGDRARMN